MKIVDLSKVFFMLVCFVVVLLAGVVIGAKKWFPYNVLKLAWDESRSAISTFQNRPTVLEKTRYPGNGVTLNTVGDDGKLILVQGMFQDVVAIQLLDRAGNKVQEWEVDFFKLFPDTGHIIPQSNVPRTGIGFHSQGVVALPDGSVVFNIAEKGLAKLDRCGGVVWTVNRMTHHSVAIDRDGSFWVPSKGNIDELDDRYILPGLTKADLLSDASKGWYEDTLLHVSQDGDILQEISLLKALLDAGLEKHFHYVARFDDPQDPTHINDIEVVTPVLAGKLPGVEAGDLLVSARNIDMLVIISRETGQLLWSATGDWRRQHDLDILPDGTISIFNNGGNDFALNRTPGSNVYVLDPETRQGEIYYPKSESQRFYTRIMGSSEILPNGNVLVAESIGGRVFEANSEEGVVWEYVVPYGDTGYAAVFETALQYDESYFSVRDWVCQ